MSSEKTDALNSAIAARDPLAIESAIASLGPEDSQNCPLLIQLLTEKWHQRHEDIVHLLQQWKDPSAIPALHKVALAPLHEYLELDFSYALCVR